MTSIASELRISLSIESQEEPFRRQSHSRLSGIFSCTYSEGWLRKTSSDEKTDQSSDDGNEAVIRFLYYLGDALSCQYNFVLRES